MGTGETTMSFQKVADKHQKKIARDTMKLHCLGAKIMGGMDHPTAAKILGKPVPNDCTCQAPE
jgi:hypothetical protein